MKKITSLFAAAVALLMFVSCGKKIDTTTWLTSLEDGKIAAKKENKKILLFFSTDDSDGLSSTLKETIFKTDNFIQTFTAQFVLVNIDFSESRFEKAQQNPESEEISQKELKKMQDALYADMRAANLYNIQATPWFIILTKQGYAISQLAFDAEDDFETVTAAFNAEEETLKLFDSYLAKIEKGSKDEKIAAIDAIYEMTDPFLRYHISDLSKKLIYLDRNNETGLCGKHILALAYAKATDAYLNNTPEKASEEFALTAQNKLLLPIEKQQSFYLAAYLLAQNGSTDYPKIKDYFQSAYNAAPESEEAAQIKAMIAIVEERMASAEELYSEPDFAGQEPDNQPENQNSDEPANASAE